MEWHIIPGPLAPADEQESHTYDEMSIHDVQCCVRVLQYTMRNLRGMCAICTRCPAVKRLHTGQKARAVHRLLFQ
jgi:hypothetical protein